VELNLGLIEQGQEERGVSGEEADRRVWATVNKETGEGNKSEVADPTKTISPQLVCRRPTWRTTLVFRQTIAHGDTIELREERKDFQVAVNMAPAELIRWLATDESRCSGWPSGEGWRLSAIAPGEGSSRSKGSER
jgi:hypothetical protein